MLNVTYFNRSRRSGNYSIEELFHTIRSGMEDVVSMRDYTCNSEWSRLKLACDVHRYEGDVNHITGDVNFLAYGLSPQKTILTVHDVGYYENTLRGLKKAVYAQFWLRGPFHRVKYLTTISEFTKSRMMHHFHLPSDKIHVIPNPCPPSFSPGTKSFHSECPSILQIGGGVTKNAKRLIEAVKGLSCELIFIREEDQSLVSLLKKNNIRYRFLSNLTYEAIAEVYKNCDLLFFASEYEGFGMPILEAQASGIPVLTSNVASMPEVAGDAAYLVDPFDTSAIRKGIQKIIEEKSYREELTTKGYENTKRFQWKDIANRYLELYQDVSRT